MRTGTNTYSVSYSYDNTGNRLTRVQGGVTESYTYDDANKLLSAGSKTYGYDNAGNCTSVTNGGTTTNLTWDAESRLTSVSGSGGGTYTYNGIGQRVRKVEGGTTFDYTREDDAIDSAVLADGAATYQTGLGNGPVLETRGGVSKVYHADALGTTRALSDGTGTRTDSLDTDGFGRYVTGTGSTPTPFGFAGQHGYQGDTSGLMLLGHRYYDASTGRFLSRDPILDGYNWYTYCENDPVNTVDPEGLQDSKDDKDKKKPPKPPELDPRKYWDTAWGAIGGYVANKLGGGLIVTILGALGGAAIGDILWDGFVKNPQVLTPSPDPGVREQYREVHGWRDDLGLGFD